MLTEPMLITIAVTGFTVAFFHAALPTHWLPFVLAGKGQKWTKSKTLGITALASLGHVTFTTLLGVLVVFLGIKTEVWTGQIFPYVVAGILFLFGSYYLVRQAQGSGGHHHWKLPWTKGGHSHSHGYSAHGHDETRRIDTGHGIVELSIMEDGMPPHFWIAFEQNGRAVAPPEKEILTVETIRPDGTTQLFEFVSKGNYLESTKQIPEPHSFEARLRIVHGNHGHDYVVAFAEHSHDHANHDHSKHSGCSDEGHNHYHQDRERDYASTQALNGEKTDKTDKSVILGLLALLTFSPCEGFLPVYLSGVKYGWNGFALLSVLLAMATMAGMVFFTWLTMVGLERVQLKVLEKYEAGILGALLWMLAVLALIME